MADKAYDPNVRMYPVGSGGFSTDVVSHILEVTRQRAEALRECALRNQRESLRENDDVHALLSSRAPAADPAGVAFAEESMSRIRARKTPGSQPEGGERAPSTPEPAKPDLDSGVHACGDKRAGREQPPRRRRKQG